MLTCYNSDQPGQFLQQLFVVPDLRSSIPNCIVCACMCLRNCAFAYL